LMIPRTMLIFCIFLEETVQFLDICSHPSESRRYHFCLGTVLGPGFSSSWLLIWADPQANDHVFKNGSCVVAVCFLFEDPSGWVEKGQSIQ
jgi:hypothetical protein